jgi:hypothetical protein
MTEGTATSFLKGRFNHPQIPFKPAIDDRGLRYPQITQITQIFFRLVVHCRETKQSAYALSSLLQN